MPGPLFVLVHHWAGRLVSTGFDLVVAVAAVHWLVTAGLERDLGVLATFATDDWVHLPWSPVSVAAAEPTTTATARLP